MAHKKIIIIVLLSMVFLTSLYFNFSQNKQGNLTSDFQKKQECTKYGDLVNTKIEESGRVFENDTYSVKGIFYSPQLDTCLYAWVLHTTFDPTEIYSIDDIFGVGVFTAGISENSSELFFNEIERLKK